ncbi:MAG TPA: DUF397 domain-containing protein [Pseudonocardiaceae bacterium]|nr:DUF397 domain-containing protein [Pseudonocardiaceae bacterium]
MTTQDADRSPLVWRTSSYSGGQGQCVEVAFRDGRVGLRDSKHPEPVMWLDGVEFAALARLRP